MDFSRLSDSELRNFLVHHGTEVSQDREDRINQVGQLWMHLATNGQLTVPNLTLGVLNLYLGTQVRNYHPRAEPYRLSLILAIPQDTLLEFQQAFSIPFPPNPSLSDYEYLRDRLVKILRYADLLVDDVFPNQRPYNRRMHAELFEVSIPSDFDINTGALGDTDTGWIEDFFPEDIAQTEAEGNFFWDVYDPVEYEQRDIRPKIIERVSQMARARGTVLMRGDIINGGDYRNDQRFIFDGAQIQALSSDADDYGNLPSEYSFPEFPLNYWYIPSDQPFAHRGFEYAIDHNEIQWLNLPQFQAELQRNLRGPFTTPRDENNGLQPIDPTEADTHNFNYRTHIDYQGQRYNFELTGDPTPNFGNGALEYIENYFVFGGIRGP